MISKPYREVWIHCQASLSSRYLELTLYLCEQTIAVNNYHQNVIVGLQPPPLTHKYILGLGPVGAFFKWRCDDVGVSMPSVAWASAATSEGRRNAEFKSAAAHQINKPY